MRAAKGPLVWGLDPSGELLAAWELGDRADGLDRFVDIVLPVAAESVGLIKHSPPFTNDTAGGVFGASHDW